MGSFVVLVEKKSSPKGSASAALGALAAGPFAGAADAKISSSVVDMLQSILFRDENLENQMMINELVIFIITIASEFVLVVHI